MTTIDFRPALPRLLSAVGTFRTSRDVCVQSAISLKAARRRPRLFVQRPDRCHSIPSRWPRLLLENTLHHTGADAKLPADLEDAVAVGLQFKNSRFHSGLNATPAELGPIRPGARQTGVHPLSNDPSLELSKYAQHLKHRLAGGGRGIKALLMEEQINALVMKPLENSQ